MKTSLLTLSLLLLFAATDSLAGVLRVGSWSSPGSDPHSSLTAALTASTAGDDIWVVQGLYREAELTIPSGVSVYGGFIGSESSLSERNYATNVTILDGSGAHRVATVSGLLDGFTLRNGRTGDNGGGVIVKSGGVLSHCIAFANEAGYDGGGVFAEEGASVTNTLLTGNRAGNDGAAISGARGFNAMNITAADNTFTGIPVIDALSGVPASLQAGGVLDVAPPAISDDGGSTVLMKGWELDGNAISMPYTVTYADNGKKLRYWAANAVGVSVSAEVALNIEWVATFRESLRTPIAVCEGTTLADAGLVDPAFGVEPDADAGTVTREYFFRGIGGADTKLSGLDYALQYADNNKLLVCRVYKDGVLSAETPAVRVAVMKAPQILLSPTAVLSAEDGERLCLPAPVVLSNGSDVTAQGWHWKKGADGGDFTSCDVVDKATLDGATLYYTATNACSATPVSLDYGVLSVAEAVGEFSLKLDEICSGTKLADAIGFADGSRADGVYTIGGTIVPDFDTYVLTEADNLKQLKYTYNGGKNERRLTLTVHSVPTIRTQPVSPADAICKGSGHSLNVVVSGENLRYQWEESADNGTTWSPVAGATDSYLRLNVENDRQYHCTVTGVCISKAAGYDDVKKQIVSSAATIAVTDRPAIGLPTISDFGICEQATLGSILTASGVEIDGAAADPDNGTQGWTLGGIKVLTTYPVTASDDGKVLGYWASNGCGESTRTFDGAVLAVSKKVSILQPPTDVSVNEGSKVRLSVLTGNTAGTVTYQWYKKNGGIDEVVSGGTGGTTPTYTFDAPLLSAAEAAAGESITQTYFCRITSTNACDGDAPTDTDPVTVTILRTSTAVEITAQPSGYDICAGETMKALSVTATGRGKLSYQWYRNGRKAVEGTSAGQDGVGATSASFTPNTGGTYYCLVASSDNAQGLRSEEAIVTVHQVPAINIPLATAFSTCKGSNISLQFVVGAGSDGVTYKWYDKAHAGVTLSTDSRLSVAASSTATYVVEATPEWCANKVAAGVNLKPEVVVTVTDVPAITNGPTAQVTLCENTVIGTLTMPAITDNGSAVISQSWTLNGINIDPATYKVSSADHGKVLGYRVRNACGETVVTFDAATLNIEKRPQLLQVPVDVTTEENNQVRLSVLTAENNVTYAWYKEGTATAIVGATGSTYAYTPAVLTGADLTNGERTEKYYCVITTTTSMCKGNNADANPEVSPDKAFEKSSSATVTIRRKTTDITIEAQPDAFPEACDGFIDKVNEGATGGIRVTATGRGPLTFRWYKNGKAVVAGDGAAVESAGTALPADPDNALAPTLRQTSTFTPTAAGTYYCLVTSADNTTGVRSEQSVLTVHGIPAITENLTDLTRTLCADSELSLRIAATGSNRAYQWQKKTTAGFVNIAGETDVRLRTTVDADATYRCVVTATCKAGDPADKAELNSAEVVVTMSQKPAVTLKNPANITQCEGAAINLPTANLTVNDNHSAIPADGQWWTLGGQKVAAGYLLKTSDSGKSLGYRAANGCGETVVTFPVTVQVDDNPVIVQDPQDAEVQMGSNVRLSVRATGSGTLAYQWQKKAVGDAGFTAVTDGGTVSGAKTNTLSFIAAAITDITVNEVKTQYRCVVTTNNVCGSSATSLASTVTVQRTKSNISILRQPQGYEICKGAAFQNLTVEVSGTGEFWYEWFKSDGTVVKPKVAASTVNTTDSYLPTAAGTFYCVVTSTDDATGVRTQQVLVTEYQVPVNVTVSPDNTSVCEGNTVTLGVSMAAGDSPVYQWYSKTAAGGGSAGGTICTGATSSTFTPLSLTANADGTAKDYYYYCEVVSKYCAGTKVASSLAAVKVNKSPKISVQPKSQTICQGDAAPLSITAATDKANGYTWYLNGVAQAGTSNSFNATKAGVYTCEVSSQQCGSVLSAPALITVAATPGINLASTDGGDLTACKGDLVVLPSPLIDAKGSVILTDKSGWHTAAAPAKLISSYVVSKEETWTYKLMYKCSEDAVAEKTYTGVAPTLKVKMTALPTVTGTLKDVTKNAGESVAEAEVVTSLAVTGGTKQWLLGGTPVTLPFTTTSADHGKLFTCEVTNACGAKAMLSAATGKLTVNSLVITTQPVSQAYCEGVAGKKLGVETNITAGVTYQWYKDGAKITVNGTVKEYALGSATTDAGVYTCEVKLGTLTVVSSPAVVTVNAKPSVVNNSQNVTVCKGSPVTLQVEAKGHDLQYSWDQGIASTSSAVTVSPAATTTYTCTVKNSCDNVGKTSAIMVTVNTPVQLTSQPKDQNECSYVALSVAATGTATLSYKWSKDGAAINGATSASYTPTADGVYTCEVSNACGSVTSAPAVVKKKAATAIVTQPVAATICKGENVSLGVKATGNDLTYQWYSGTVSGTVTTLISGATSATLSVSPAVNTYYKCTVSGCTSVTSSVVLVTVNTPVQLTSQPKDQNECSYAALSVAATGTATISYKWYFNGAAATTAQLDKLTEASATPKVDGVYTCEVLNACGSVTSAPAVVKKKAATAIATQPVAATICKGESVSLGVKATGDDLTYQWYSGTTSGTVTTLISGATSATLSVSPAVNTYYKCTVSGCTSVTSNVVLVTVNSPVQLTSQPKDQNECSYAALSVAATGTATLSYKWSKDGAAINAATSASYTPTADGVYTCEVSNACGSVTSAPAVVKKKAATAIATQPVAATICKGESVSLGVKATGDDLTYQWYSGTVSGTVTTLISGATSATLSVSPTVNTYYKCTVSGCTSVTSNVVLVTVNSPVQLTSQPKDQNECSYGALSVAATGTATISYKWYFNGIAATTAQLDKLTEASATPKVDGVYTCEVLNACGSVTSAPAVVKKKAATAIAMQPVAATICKGESVSLGVKATGDDLTYQWYSGTTNNPTTLISGATSATLSVSPAVNTYYKCTVSGCSSVNSNVVLVTVRSATDITALSGQPSGKVCNTATMPTLTVAATGDGTLTYQWYKDGAAIGGATGASYAVRNTDLGSHNYEVRVTGNCGSLLSQAAVVEIVKAPVVSLPTAGITACRGDVITLPVPAIEANGSVIDQGSTGWCSSANETLVNSWKVSGTTATTWRYKVAYTCGATTGQKLFSGNLTVTPNEAPTITLQPKSEVKCAADAFTNLSVTATGTAPAYQWYKDNATQSGATGSTYVVGQNAGVYHCVVSNACGTVTSAPATLTRHAAISATAYADKSDLCGSEATIVGVKVTAGAPVSYQWDKGGTAINGATSSTMAVVGEDGTAAVSRAYNCTVTDVCGKTVNPTVPITHNPVPKITAQPVGGDVCEATKEISVTATGAKSYQWYKDGVAISTNGTANKYTVPKAMGNNSYYCKVTSENCGSVESVTVHVNIAYKPSFYSTANIGTAYEGVGTDEIVLPAPPAYNANGNVITKQEWRCADGTVIGRKWQKNYNGKKLHYYIEWNAGVCAAGNTRSPEMGTLKYLADFACDRIDRRTMARRTEYSMIDTRDGKTYGIYKDFNDLVWMADPLKYGEGSVALKADAATPSGTNEVWWNAHGNYMGGIRLEVNGEVFYSLYAATQLWAGVDGKTSDPISHRYPMRGICPPGWRLPYSKTGDSETDYNMRENRHLYDGRKSTSNIKTAQSTTSLYCSDNAGGWIREEDKITEHWQDSGGMGFNGAPQSSTWVLYYWGVGDMLYNNNHGSVLKYGYYARDVVGNWSKAAHKNCLARVRCIAD